MPDRRGIKDTYDKISPHFAETRRYPWDDVTEFISTTSGDVGLDLGVGNGRHAQLLSERVNRVIGIDISHVALEQAIDRATTHGFQLQSLVGDAAALPIQNHRVDIVVYIATLHHLPSRILRIQSLNEVARVLSPGGSGIISVWSTTHNAFNRAESFDTYLDWTLPDGTTVPRFYHIYDPNDFTDELAESCLEITRVFRSRGNCYAIVE